VHHYVDRAVDAQNLEGVERVGIDETSSRRGHDYVSVFADLDQRRGVFVVEGRDHETVQAFSLFLETHGGDPEQVKEVSQDMSEAFLKGTLTYLPKAEITFDRYHIKSHLSKAVDEVRREESKHYRELLANTRYLWLKRPTNLTEKQRDLLDELLTQPLQTVRAYTLAQQFDSFYEFDDPDTAEEYLRRWIVEVGSSGLEPLQKFARMLEDHWLGVIRWHHSRVSNGLLEGLNSLIQAAKRRARGYRSNRNFIAMIYLIVGKLNAGPVTA
jgi:transposase